MTIQEKILRIKSRCTELLALAEKRTPGEWHTPKGYELRVVSHEDTEAVVDCESSPRSFARDADNAAFIASCAGAAEAGWRTTIAAIDRVLSGYAYWQLGRADQITLEEIAATWPDELL